MGQRLRRAWWAAVWCSVGWNVRGLLEYVADRMGDTGPRRPS